MTAAFEMEPCLPAEGDPELGDLAIELVQEATALAAPLPAAVQESLGALVRSMNCYYSNFIEGHDTHPRDIDRALQGDYSDNPKQRALQDEALAHIDLQRRIDIGADEDGWPAEGHYIRWLHREFCSKLPQEMLWIENPDTHERLKVEPGKFRTRDVKVG